MKNIFRHIAKYWYAILLIFLLLIVQAYCDLSLPDYTSGLIDTGIANSGIEHAVPEYITAGGFIGVEAFLTEDEKADWDAAYTYDENNGYYTLSSADDWESLDEEFSKAIAVVYMMTSQQGSATEGMDLSGFANMDMTAIDPAMMSAEQLEQLREVQQILSELGVDIGSETLLLDIRGVFEEQLGTLGDSIIASMAKQFAREQYELCGTDMEKMQTDYLWRTGIKMLIMALIMAFVAIIIGFLASKTAAGVGRDLRNKIFTKVIGFSSAELDRFSTASLITRSTNDVQ